jgi:hypothetical protein
MGTATRLLGNVGTRLLGRYGRRLLNGVETRLLGTAEQTFLSQGVPFAAGHNIDNFLGSKAALVVAQVKRQPGAENQSATFDLELRPPSVFQRKPFVFVGVAAVGGLVAGVLAGRWLSR